MAIKIDTEDYKSLYGRIDILRHGRYRKVPDPTIRPEIWQMIEKIENGETRVPKEQRLINQPLFQKESKEEKAFVFNKK